MSKSGNTTYFSSASSTTSSGISSISSSCYSSISSNAHSKCECTKCTYCQMSLGTVSVKCAECCNIHLCLKCFSMSAEIGEHKKDHNYYLKSPISFPLFDNEKSWSYKEELLLLQVIEQYGFGNWDEIAKHLPNRTAEGLCFWFLVNFSLILLANFDFFGLECMQHYHSYYIYGNLGTSIFLTFF